MDDFDDLLPRLNAQQHFLAERLFPHLLDEVAGDLEIDVGFEQRHADFAQGIGDVALGDLAEAAQVAEGVL